MKLRPTIIIPCMGGFLMGIVICVGVLCEALRKMSVGIPIGTAFKHVEAFCWVGVLLIGGCLLYLSKVAEEIIRRLDSLPHDEG